MKIVLNYDESTGNITDNNNTYLFSVAGLDNHVVSGNDSNRYSIDDIIRLRDSGFEITDILALREIDLI